MNIYTYDLTVTIGDTNMEGNVYWLKFLEWFGRARELFLLNLLPEVNMPDFLMGEKGMTIATRDIQSHFKKSAYFTDNLQLQIFLEKLQNASAVIAFQTVNKNTGEILNEGRQTLAFIDIHTGKPGKMPSEIKEAAKEYLVAN